MWVGGDKYCESDQYITWTRDAAVKLKYGREGTMQGMPAMTLMTMVKATVQKLPNHKALGKWTVLLVDSSEMCDVLLSSM